MTAKIAIGEQRVAMPLSAPVNRPFFEVSFTSVESSHTVISPQTEYDDMDEHEEEAAFRALSMSRLQSELDDEPDFDSDV